MKKEAVGGKKDSSFELEKTFFCRVVPFELKKGSASRESQNCFLP